MTDSVQSVDLLERGDTVILNGERLVVVRSHEDGSADLSIPNALGHASSVWKHYEARELRDCEIVYVIKPCPFCGNKDLEVSMRVVDTATEKTWGIDCCVTNEGQLFNTPSEAIHHLNTRTK
jgi:hypothetical protein